MENIKAVQESFSVQAEGFESKQMNFSKQEYLDYIVKRNRRGKNGQSA